MRELYRATDNSSLPKASRLTLLALAETRTENGSQAASEQFSHTSAGPLESANAKKQRVLTYPGGSEITFGNKGRVVSIKSPDRERHFTWDETSPQDKLIGVKVTLKSGKKYDWRFTDGQWTCDGQKQQATFSLDRRGLYTFTIDSAQTVQRPDGATETRRSGVLKERSFAGGLTIEYRPDGKMAKIVDGEGTTRSFSYSPDGKLCRFTIQRQGQAPVTYELIKDQWLVDGKPTNMRFHIEPYKDSRGNSFDAVYSFTDTRTGKRYYLNPLGTVDTLGQDGVTVQHRNGAVCLIKDGRITRTEANGVIREFKWMEVQPGKFEIAGESISTGGKTVTWTRKKDQSGTYTNRWLSSSLPPAEREGVLTVDAQGQSIFQIQKNGAVDGSRFVTCLDGATLLEDPSKKYRVRYNQDRTVSLVDFADGMMRKYTWAADEQGKKVVQTLAVSKDGHPVSTWTRIARGKYRSNSGTTWDVDFEVTASGVHSVIDGDANSPTRRYFPDGRLEIDNKRSGNHRHVVTRNGDSIERVQIGNLTRQFMTDEIRDEITNTVWRRQQSSGQDGTEFTWTPSRLDTSKTYDIDQQERTGQVDVLSSGTYSFRDSEGVRIVHSAGGRVIKMDREGLKAEIKRTFTTQEDKQIRERLLCNLDLVERRAAIDKLTPAERSEAYYQAYRLLDARGQTGEKPFGEADRRVLFEQLLWSYAHPRLQHQGYHATCGLTAPRACLLLKEPSVVGRVVADMVTTGTFRTKSNVEVKVDRLSLEPDSEARRSWPSRHLNPRLDSTVADWPAHQLDPALKGIRVKRSNGVGPVHEVIDVRGSTYEIIPAKNDPQAIDKVIMPPGWPPAGVHIPAGAIRLTQEPYKGRYALTASKGQIKLDLENGAITQTPGGRERPSAIVRVEQSPWPAEDKRLWLGQIFDLTAGNIAYEKRSFGPEGQPLKSGERLLFRQRPPTRQEDTGERTWIAKPDGTYVEYPKFTGTYPSEGPCVCREMGAKQEVREVSRYGADSVKSPEEFRALMENLHKNGGFPVVLFVHTKHAPFNPFNQQGGNWHVIPVYDYDQAKGIVYCSSNYSVANHSALRDGTGQVRSPGSGIPVERLFKAMVE